MASELKDKEIQAIAHIVINFGNSYYKVLFNILLQNQFIKML